MPNTLEIVNFALGLCLLGFAIFLKVSWTNYAKKKGENRATKEDIKEITSIVETVKKEFSEGMSRLNSDLSEKLERTKGEIQLSVFKDQEVFSQFREVFGVFFSTISRSFCLLNQRYNIYSIPKKSKGEALEIVSDYRRLMSEEAANSYVAYMSFVIHCKNKELVELSDLVIEKTNKYRDSMHFILDVFTESLLRDGVAPPEDQVNGSLAKAGDNLKAINESIIKLGKGYHRIVYNEL